MSTPQNFQREPNHILPDITVAGNIEIYENVWKNSAQTISEIERVCGDPESGINWTKATILGEGVNASLRSNWDMSISYYGKHTGHPLMKFLHNSMNELIIDTATGYCSRQGITEDFWQEGYNVLKYRSGEHYGQHYDSGTYAGRHISIILYLNDDYEGGEIEFPPFGFKIKPKAGMMLMFPSNFAYRHIAHPVISGTKYAVVTWLHDRPI